ncbi:MAG: metallophosphoesterase [Firmicutes bacterium]|nr:metallophosphoesterase [Bacillota bacterium]
MSVIMHISDLHFGRNDISNKNYVANRNMVIESFFESFLKIPENWKPDILVVTGDIAYSGKSEEYELAKDFFNKFLNLKKQKITKNDLIICPGNHDVFIPDDRRRESRPKKDNMDLLDVDDLTRDNIQSSKYKFKAYVNFMKNFGTGQMTNTNSDNDISYLYGFRKCKGVNFIVLNTEWDFGGKSDKNAVGCLRIGADLVADAFEMLYNEDEAECDPIIALFHRPIEEMHISERNNHIVDSQNNLKSHTNIEERLNNHSDIILHGHAHISAVKSNMIRAITYTCGTIHDPTTGEPSFWLFNIRNKGDGSSRKYKWIKPSHKKRNGEWLVDSTSHYNDKPIFIEDVEKVETKQKELAVIIKKIIGSDLSQGDMFSQAEKAIKEAEIKDSAKIIFSVIVKELIEKSKKVTKTDSTVTNRYVGDEKKLTLGLGETRTQNTEKDEKSRIDEEVEK